MEKLPPNAAEPHHPHSQEQGPHPALQILWQLPASNGKGKLRKRSSGQVESTAGIWLQMCWMEGDAVLVALGDAGWGFASPPLPLWTLGDQQGRGVSETGCLGGLGEQQGQQAAAEGKPAPVRGGSPEQCTDGGQTLHPSWQLGQGQRHLL